MRRDLFVPGRAGGCSLVSRGEQAFFCPLNVGNFEFEGKIFPLIFLGVGKLFPLIEILDFAEGATKSHFPPKARRRSRPTTKWSGSKSL